MGLDPECRIQGSNLGDRTALGAPTDPPLPLDRPKQAHHLARGKALAPQRGPTGRAGGPGGWLARPFGEHSFEQVHREDTGDLPCRQNQGGERRGVFHRSQQTLHGRIIIAYAVVKA